MDVSRRSKAKVRNLFMRDEMIQTKPGPAANFFPNQYIHCGILDSSDWLADLTSSHGCAQGFRFDENYDSL
jgi:hypothetical protein